MLDISYYGVKSAHVIEQEEKGKFLIGEIRENGDTRVYIFSLCSITNYYAKDGYWNTFAYTSEKNLEAGYYFFVIKEFRRDKNGFLNIVLSNAKYYFGKGKSVFNNHQDVFRFFGMSGLMSEHYTDFVVCRDFSIEKSFALYKLPEYGIYEAKQLSRIYFAKFIANEITVEKLDDMLHVESSYLDWYMSEWEARVKYILRNYKAIAEKYPLAYKRIAKIIEDNSTFNVLAMEKYLTDMYFVYDNILSEKKVNEVDKYFSEQTGEMDLLQMIENVAMYYKKQNDLKKLNRRNKKKMGGKNNDETKV